MEDLGNPRARHELEGGQRLNLGHGVRVREHGSSGLTVESHGPVLDWRPPAGSHVGTAVIWNDQLWQVTDAAEMERGYRWALEPWPEGEAVRVTFPLDRATVAAIAQEQRRDSSGKRRRWWLTLASPAVGFLPTAHQLKIQNDLGYSAGRATAISAILEVVVGGALLLQLMLLLGGGFTFLPSWLVVFSPVGPVIWLEGLIRLAMVVSTGEPMGTLLGFAVQLFWQIDPKSPSVRRDLPQVRRFEADEGRLELITTMQRPDWEIEGVLPYKGSSFRRESVTREGSGWVYCFRRIEGESGRGVPDLRLLPPPLAPVFEAPQRVPTHPIKTTIVFTLMCLAPAEHQQRWARERPVSPFFLTACGAAAALLGGAVGLGEDLRSGSPWLLFDLYLVAEGLLRLAWVAFLSRPLGSLIGMPLARLTRRWSKQAPPPRSRVAT